MVRLEREGRVPFRMELQDRQEAKEVRLEGKQQLPSGWSSTRSSSSASSDEFWEFCEFASFASAVSFAGSAGSTRSSSSAGHLKFVSSLLQFCFKSSLGRLSEAQLFQVMVFIEATLGI